LQRTYYQAKRTDSAPGEDEKNKDSMNVATSFTNTERRNNHPQHLSLPIIPSLLIYKDLRKIPGY